MGRGPSSLTWPTLAASLLLPFHPRLAHCNPISMQPPKEHPKLYIIFCMCNPPTCNSWKAFHYMQHYIWNKIQLRTHDQQSPITSIPANTSILSSMPLDLSQDINRASPSPSQGLYSCCKFCNIPFPPHLSRTGIFLNLQVCSKFPVQIGCP